MNGFDKLISDFRAQCSETELLLIDLDQHWLDADLADASRERRERRERIANLKARILELTTD